MNKLKISIFFLLFLILTIVGVFYFSQKTQENSSKNINQIFLKAKYPDKIVYFPQKEKIKLAEKDCEEREGRFDECGSDCSSFSSEECSKICNYVCVLEKENKNEAKDDWKKYEDEEWEFSLKYQPNLNLLKRENGIELLARNYETRDFDFEFKLKKINYEDEFEKLVFSEFSDLSNRKSDISSPVMHGDISSPSYSFRVEEKEFFIKKVNPGKALFVSYFFKDSKFELLGQKIIDTLIVRPQENPELEIFDLQVDQIIKNPLVVSGIVSKNWLKGDHFFVYLDLMEGGILTEKKIVFSQEELNKDFISFEFILNFKEPKEGKAYLVFENDENEPTKNKAIELGFTRGAYDFENCVAEEGQILTKDPFLCKDSEGDIFIK